MTVSPACSPHIVAIPLVGSGRSGVGRCGVDSGTELVLDECMPLLAGRNRNRADLRTHGRGRADARDEVARKRFTSRQPGSLRL